MELRRTGRAAACRWCVARAGRSAPGPPAPGGKSARRRRAARRAAARAKRSSSASANIAGALQAVKQVEADDRARVAQQRAGGDLVGFVGGDPVGDDPPERGERTVGGARTPRHRTSRRRRRPRVPPLASIRRSVSPSGSGSMATSAPSSSASARFSSLEAVAITRPAPSACPSCTASEPDAARGRVDDDALALGHAAGGAVQVPGGGALHDHRQRRAVVEPVGDREDAVLGRERVLGVAALARRARRRARRCPRAAGDLPAGHQRQRCLLHVGVGARVRVGEVQPRPASRGSAPRPRPGSGVGSSASWSTSGPPNSVIWIARMTRGYRSAARAPARRGPRAERGPPDWEAWAPEGSWCSKVRAHANHRGWVDRL